MGWKVYFWFYAIGTVLGSFAFVSKVPVSGGDAISIGYSATLVLMLHAYAFQKKLFSKKTWGRLFWLAIGITIFGLIDFLFVPKSLSQKYYPFLTSNVDSGPVEMWLGYLISIPTLVAGYRLMKK